MWVVRNNRMGDQTEGAICLFSSAPERDPRGFWKPRDGFRIELGCGYFSGLKWEDDPLEVELVPKKSAQDIDDYVDDYIEHFEDPTVRSVVIAALYNMSEYIKANK